MAGRHEQPVARRGVETPFENVSLNQERPGHEPFLGALPGGPDVDERRATGIDRVVRLGGRQPVEPAARGCQQLVDAAAALAVPPAFMRPMKLTAFEIVVRHRVQCRRMRMEADGGGGGDIPDVVDATEDRTPGCRPSRRPEIRPRGVVPEARH